MGEMGLDLLALLESAPAQCMNREQVDAIVAHEPVDAIVPLDPIPGQGDPEPNPDVDANESFPPHLHSMVGRVGAGRFGEKFERSLLTLHMRQCKEARKNATFRASVANALEDSTFRKDGQLVAVHAKATSSGIVISLERRQLKGNRFQRALKWGQFFEAAYGQLRRDSHIALAMGVSRSTSAFMTATVGSTYLAQQLSMLARLVSIAKGEPPEFIIRHYKWDETQLMTSVNPDKGKTRVQSAWEVMVSRQRCVLGWKNGAVMIFRTVLPPVVLLAGGAHHMWYAQRYHPSFKALNELLDLLGGLCKRRVELLESDGAYSNERLIAHVIQKSKAAKPQRHLVYSKCQNHQSQLIACALLATAGHNILSRLYGLLVYLRLLGNWLRLKQAVFTWVDKNLLFLHQRPETEEASMNPAVLELVDFLKRIRRWSVSLGRYQPIS